MANFRECMMPAKGRKNISRTEQRWTRGKRQEFDSKSGVIIEFDHEEVVAYL